MAQNKDDEYIQSIYDEKAQYNNFTEEEYNDFAEDEYFESCMNQYGRTHCPDNEPESDNESAGLDYEPDVPCFDEKGELRFLEHLQGNSQGMIRFLGRISPDLPREYLSGIIAEYIGKTELDLSHLCMMEIGVESYWEAYQANCVMMKKGILVNTFEDADCMRFIELIMDNHHSYGGFCMNEYKQTKLNSSLSMANCKKHKLAELLILLMNKFPCFDTDLLFPIMAEKWPNYFKIKITIEAK